MYAHVLFHELLRFVLSCEWGGYCPLFVFPHFFVPGHISHLIISFLSPGKDEDMTWSSCFCIYTMFVISTAVYLRTLLCCKLQHCCCCYLSTTIRLLPHPPGKVVVVVFALFQFEWNETRHLSRTRSEWSHPASPGQIQSFTTQLMLRISPLSDDPVPSSYDGPDLPITHLVHAGLDARRGALFSIYHICIWFDSVFVLYTLLLWWSSSLASFCIHVRTVSTTSPSIHAT